MAVMAFFGCEKVVLDEENGTPVAADANVILHFTMYDQEDFTRAATDITALCSRINLAVFDAEGTKVKTLAQKEGDASYGTVELSLAAGTYKLVVMAHNCDGSATLGAGTISGWDVPTKAQMELIEAQRASISGVTDGRYYLWRKMDGNYCSHPLGTTSYGTAITTNWPTSYDIYLRPVAEVTVAAGE